MACFRRRDHETFGSNSTDPKQEPGCLQPLASQVEAPSQDKDPTCKGYPKRRPYLQAHGTWHLRVPELKTLLLIGVSRDYEYRVISPAISSYERRGSKY